MQFQISHCRFQISDCADGFGQFFLQKLPGALDMTQFGAEISDSHAQDDLVMQFGMRQKNLSRPIYSL
jgi:hypothetical protein